MDQETYLSEQTLVEPNQFDTAHEWYTQEVADAYEQLPFVVPLKRAVEFIGASDGWVKDKACLLEAELKEPLLGTDTLFIAYKKQTVLEIYEIFHSIPMQGTALSLNDLEKRTGMSRELLTVKLR